MLPQAVIPKPQSFCTIEEKFMSYACFHRRYSGFTGFGASLCRTVPRRGSIRIQANVSQVLFDTDLNVLVATVPLTSQDIDISFLDHRIFWWLLTKSNFLQLSHIRGVTLWVMMKKKHFVPMLRKNCTLTTLNHTLHWSNLPLTTAKAVGEAPHNRRMYVNL